MKNLSLFILFLMISVTSFAQVKTDSLATILDEQAEFDVYVNRESQLKLSPSRSDSKSKVQGINPIDQIWDQTFWPDSRVNFAPKGHFTNLGDINGDGFTDLAKQVVAPDERDNNLSTTIAKTIIHYGGPNLSTEHDKVYYFSIIAIGDINGDGFADAIGEKEDLVFLQGSENGYTESPFSKLQEIYEVLDIATFSIKDVNNDGIDDLVGTERGTVFEIFEILGNTDLNKIEINIYNIGGNGSGVGNFERNDITYYTLLRGVSFEFYLIERDSNKIVSADTINLPRKPRHGFTFINDFNGNGEPDILFKDEINNWHFLESDTTSGRLFRYAQKPEFENFGSFDINLDTLFPIGDVTGNGKENLLAIGDSVIVISEIENRESYNIVGKKSYKSSEIISGATFNKIQPIVSKEYSKLLSDEESFLVTLNSVKNGFGHFIVEIENQFPNSDPNTTLIKYESDDYAVKIRSEIYPVEDLENDGIGNFAVEEVILQEYSLFIYNGINDESPTEIPVPENHFVKAVVSGNFTDTEDHDIAVIFRPFQELLDQGVEYNIALFNLSNIDTPFFEISASELLGNGTADNLKVSTLSNLGDVNNDGLADLGIGAPIALSNDRTAHEKFYIFLGNQTLANTPDNVIDYSFLDKEVGSLGIGGTVKGVGDINNDGIDDFIVADYSREISESVEEQSNGYISGVMYVHLGQNVANPDFSTPDFELQADTTEIETEQWFFGFNEVAVGDFNGDGLKDLVGKAFRHGSAIGPFSEREGNGAIHFFFGKDGFSNQPDTLIPIRNELVLNTEDRAQRTYAWVFGRALLHATPDLTGDGFDELLMIPSQSHRNAVLYEGGTSLSEESIALFNSPNPSLSLNPAGNYINTQYNSIVGDFNGDGRLNFIGYQPGDRNYRDTPIYMFDLESSVVSNEDNRTYETPNKFVLEQNYPNPFNPSTTIKYSVGEAGPVSITVYNVMGQKVAELLNTTRSAGEYQVTWNADNQASGIYYYRLTAPGQVITRQMTLIK